MALALEILRLRLEHNRQEDAIAMGLVMPALIHHRRRQRRARRLWSRAWLTRRMERGHYTQLMDELEREEPDDFKSFPRMDPALFQELSQRLEG